MKRYSFLFALATIAATCGSLDAQVYSGNRSGGYQPYQPYPRPQLSPYLNLIRGGDPAANYFMGTIPQRNQIRTNRQFLSALQQLDRGQRQLERPSGTGLELYVPLGTTGHPSAFMQLGSYFPARSGTPDDGPPNAAAAAATPRSVSRSSDSIARHSACRICDCPVLVGAQALACLWGNAASQLFGPPKDRL